MWAKILAPDDNMWCEIIERTAVYVYNKDMIPSSTEYVLHEFQPKQLSQLFFILIITIHVCICLYFWSADPIYMYTL